MYIDTVVLSSLILVAIICVIMAYMGVYFFRHIKSDSEKALHKDKTQTDAKV